MNNPFSSFQRALRMFLMAFALLVMPLGFSVQSMCAASIEEQNSMLKKLNQALAEQNQAIAEQNQALVEQAATYDARIQELETSLEEMRSKPNKGADSASSASWPLYVVIALTVLNLLFFILSRTSSRNSSSKPDKKDETNRSIQSELLSLSNAISNLEKRVFTKEKETKEQITQLSDSLSALQTLQASSSAAAAASVFVPDEEEESEVAGAEGETVEDEDDGRSGKISGDACFAALSILFIRNEQRAVAIDGGVSITTANKWLDGWERNGWVEKVSRGKYMKTTKGKKVTKSILDGTFEGSQPAE